MAFRRRASIRAELTDCSVLVRGLRSGAGRRLAGRERRAISRTTFERMSSLRPSVSGQPTLRERAGVTAASSAGPAVPAAVSATQQQPPPASAEQETVFWQSIANSTDPADFEAYLDVFPNGVFRRLAENRLRSLWSPTNASSSSGGGVGSPGSGTRETGAGGAAFGGAGNVDASRRAGDRFP